MNTDEEIELAAALLTQATPDAAVQLQELAAATDNKDTRKAARRALYLLSQRGVLPTPKVVPALAPHAVGESIGSIGSSGSTGKFYSLERERLKAYASAYDGAGNRMVLLTWPNADGGSPSFLQVLLSDEEGVKDIATRRVARPELAARLEGFATQLEDGIAIAEIEADYGRFLLHQARTLNQQRRKQTPAGFLDVLRIIGEPQRDYREAPIWSVLSADEVRADAGVSDDPAELFRSVWFESWFLDVNEVTPWLQAVLNSRRSADALESPSEDSSENTSEDSSGDLISNSAQDGVQNRLQDSFEEEQRRELDKTVKEAADALIENETRARYTRRLEESADILYRRNQDKIARQALRHALHLREAVTAAESPFAVLLVQRTLQVAMEMKHP